MLTIEPLDAPFGVRIRGADLARDQGPETLRTLVQALYENRLIVISGQDLTKAQYLAFGEQFGRPHPHVLDHLRMPGYPGLMAVGNSEEKDRKDSVRNGAVFWHTDQSYEAEPASATMLYAIKVPRVGGETQIADMVGAYDALDDDIKKKIEPLEVAHLYGAASGRDGEKIAAPIINERQRRKVPTVHHPLVLRHPVTGTRALYAVAGTPAGIKGLAADEAAALLAELKAHALQERFIYRHRYEVGDIAVYDTLATLHSGVAIEVPKSEQDVRLMWRISIKGRPRVVQDG